MQVTEYVERENDDTMQWC